MPKVIFACNCPQSHVAVFVHHADDPTAIASLLFQTSGKKSITVAFGNYDVGYRAQGTPNTVFSVGVTEGGTMTPIGRTLPGSRFASGVRALVVA